MAPERRTGSQPGRFDAELDPLGLGDEAMVWSSAQQAVLVLQAILGVRLQPEMFGDPWRAGEVR